MESGARPDISLNVSDFSITIGRLQVDDNGHLECTVRTDIETLTERIIIIAYSKYSP